MVKNFTKNFTKKLFYLKVSYYLCPIQLVDIVMKHTEAVVGNPVATHIGKHAVTGTILAVGRERALTPLESNFMPSGPDIIDFDLRVEWTCPRTGKLKRGTWSGRKSIYIPTTQVDS